MKYNKGEWSELYVILNLLNENEMILVDENLKELDKKIFEIINIKIKDIYFEIY